MKKPIIGIIGKSLEFNKKFLQHEITAFSNDGLVEGFELENKKFVLGLKWHPELMLDDNTDNIFKCFIEACIQ